mmetsp:Transcript_1335/g.2757  ORF Transcript_1335/g.2757 Transcript_1335/m.2757 type:complete len:238 (+) Transcript_1335:624-1337(+)
MAKGDARICVAWLAIMYPPEAAIRSTHTVTFHPAFRRRATCAAAKAKEVTSPPGDRSVMTTSGSLPKSCLRGLLEPTKKVTTSAKRKKSGSATSMVEKSMTTTVLEVSGVVSGWAGFSSLFATTSFSFLESSSFLLRIFFFKGFFFLSSNASGLIFFTVLSHFRCDIFMVFGTRLNTRFQISSSLMNLSLRHSHIKCWTGLFDSASKASLLMTHFKKNNRVATVKRFTMAAAAMAEF